MNRAYQKLREGSIELNLKLQEFEKSNEEIILNLAESNRGIRKLTEQLYESKLKESKNTTPSKYLPKIDLIDCKQKYEEYTDELDSLKKQEAYISRLIYTNLKRTLLENHEKADLQIDYISSQIKSCDEKILDLQQNKLVHQNKINMLQKVNGQVKLKTKINIFNFQSPKKLRGGADTDSTVESGNISAFYLARLLNHIKLLFLKVNEYSNESSAKMDIETIERGIFNISREKLLNLNEF